MAAEAGPVVVFDGMCNLCDRAVQFILAHERDTTIRFAAWQSPAGKRLLAACGMDPAKMTTVVVIAGGAARVQSDAVLEIARHLRWPWRATGGLRILPRPLRDLLYDYLARRRDRWFGRREACRVPAADVRARFLDA